MTGPDWKLLDGYLAGTASAEEREVVQRWIEESPERQAALDALRAAPAGETTWNVDAAWQRVSTRLHERPTGERETPVIPLHSRRNQQLWRIAAAVLVVAGGTLVTRQAFRDRAVDSATSTLHEVATRAGQTLEIMLPDGSHATLNAGSRLRYDFASGDARDLTLEGEAYFDVKHDTRRPFRVHAYGRVAEDVGTRFTVRAFSAGSPVDVAVAEGAVRIQRDSGDADAKLVTAGMLGTIPLAGAPTISTLPSADQYFAWTRGVLSLDGQTLAGAIPRLERWYGVKIRVTDSALANKKVSGTLAPQSLRDAMQVLTLALNASYTEAGQTITISPRAR